MMTYKGYAGMLRVDEEAGVLRGKVINTRDTITFQGKTVEEATAAFRESVDDYLEFCASLGEPPEKPFPGKILVRISPAVHRELSTIAQIKGVSVNKVIVRQLTRLTYRRRARLVAASGAPASSATKTAPARVLEATTGVGEGAVPRGSAGSAKKGKLVAG